MELVTNYPIANLDTGAAGDCLSCPRLRSSTAATRKTAQSNDKGGRNWPSEKRYLRQAQLEHEPLNLGQDCLCRPSCGKARSGTVHQYLEDCREAAAPLGCPRKANVPGSLFKQTYKFRLAYTGSARPPRQ
jgi:hypothetical protein